MSNVSLADKRLPLDARITDKVGEKLIDLLVSTLLTVYGESIVMRILDKESLSLGLRQLGFFSDDQTIFEQVINLPDGIFLVTGPTGSGKSTTPSAARSAGSWIRPAAGRRTRPPGGCETPAGRS